MTVARNQIFTALDIGSSKVVCFIARYQSQNNLRIIGIGHQVSQGLKAGNVVDLQATEDAIRSAIDSAERMAGEKVKDVVIGFSGGKFLSRIYSVDVAVSGHAITNSDLKKVLQKIITHENDDYEIVHQLPVGFKIDDTVGVRDPRGMFGAKLGVKTHLVSALTGSMQNLRLCVERGHVGIKSFTVAPYAAGLSTLVEDELRLGATIVDMGEGTTSIAVFADDEMVFTTSLPIGGGHITKDIARGLGTPIADAERIKTLYGNVLPSLADDRDVLEVPIIGEFEEKNYNPVPKSLLIGIIRPRVEEILEMIRERIDAYGSTGEVGRRVVLTGGSSQLQGIRELAASVLDKQVRIGRPINVGGLAEATCGPAFAACAGLLLFAIKEPLPVINDVRSRSWKVSDKNRFTRVGRWIFQNF